MINLHMNQYTCCTWEIVPEPNSLPMLVQWLNLFPMLH
jgi:hypothetical protein